MKIYLVLNDSSLTEHGQHFYVIMETICTDANILHTDVYACELRAHEFSALAYWPYCFIEN